MDLVVDDEAPVLRVEHVEVAVLPLRLADEHLVGRDGDGTDLLALARVLADVFLPERHVLHQFASPLPGRDRVGDEDQSRRTRPGHRRHADDRLAGAAREHDDAAPSGPEPVGCVALVRAHMERLVFSNGHRKGRAIDVAGLVVGRPADLDERLLQAAAVGRLDADEVWADCLAKHRPDLLVAADLGQHCVVVRAQREAEDRIVLQHEPAVTAHRVDDVDEHRLRNVVAAEAKQRIDALLGVVPCGPRVPQRERGDAVGVDVLGCLLQLGKRRDRHTALGCVVVIDLQQQRAIRLDDQRPATHAGIPGR